VARSTTLVTAGQIRRWRRPRPHRSYGCAFVLRPQVK
jgi:hypothetical protein